MDKQPLGILGATSLVGHPLLSLTTESQYQIHAFTRKSHTKTHPNIDWHTLPHHPSSYTHITGLHIPLWIHLAPIWVLPEYFDILLKYKARRIVALSSTSLFTKQESPDPAERSLAARLASAEYRLQQWALQNGIEWFILRPTLIYGQGRDKNISQIIRLIRRLGFFPIFGKGQGLRQPIHSSDVARACLLILEKSELNYRAYNIAGGETLPYRDMVNRAFLALDKKPRFLPMPISLFQQAIETANRLPGHTQWSTAMALRMNQDLIFDHSNLSRDTGFKPRAFHLNDEDLTQ